MIPRENDARIVEVGARDGLQNEKIPIPSEVRVRFLDELTRAGFRDIEVGSFVRPDLVPQLASTEDVFAQIEKREGTRYWVLVPNSKGLLRAIESGVRDVAIFTAASDGFNRANTNASVEESLARLKPVISRARDEGMLVRGYVSTVFGCPYDGPVEPAQAARVSRTLLDAGCAEISLGDTIGVAVPPEVGRVLEAHEQMGVGLDDLALHFHDTRGMAVANALAGFEYGVRSFDSSAGGLGGCPFAPGATGNLATEDLLYLLHGMGVSTGVSLPEVAKSSDEVERLLGKKLPSNARAALQAEKRS